MSFSAEFSEEHGGQNPKELLAYGIDPYKLIDFSVNSNPFGPAPAVLEALNHVNVSKYPDPECFLFKKALSEACTVPASNLLVGNGTAELIWLAVQSWIKKGDPALIIGPSFGEYRRALEAYGATIMEIRAEAPTFEPPVDRVLEKIRSDPPKMVFLCNPNNPTGAFLGAEVIRKISEICGDETLLVIDEAYCSFVNGECFSALPYANCLILSSMTKDFALAGLRLGYALGSEALIAQMAQYQPAWSVNAFAQTAGLAVLKNLSYYQECFIKLKTLKAQFFGELQSIGIQINKSAVHYGIFPTGIPARLVRLALLKKGIQVRDCASFGLPNHVRVSTQMESSNKQLIEELAKLKEDKHFF